MQWFHCFLLLTLCGSMLATGADSKAAELDGALDPVQATTKTTPSAVDKDMPIRIFRCHLVNKDKFDETTKTELRNALNETFELAELQQLIWTNTQTSAWTKLWHLASGRDEHYRIFTCDPKTWNVEPEKLEKDKKHFIFVKWTSGNDAANPSVRASSDFQVWDEDQKDYKRMWTDSDVNVRISTVLELNENWLSFAAPGLHDFSVTVDVKGNEDEVATYQEQVVEFYSIDSKFRCLQGFNPYAMKEMYSTMLKKLLAQRQAMPDNVDKWALSQDPEVACSSQWLGQQQATLSNWALLRESCGLDADFVKLKGQFKLARGAKKALLFAVLRFVVKLASLIPGAGDFLGIIEEGQKMVDKVIDIADTALGDKSSDGADLAMLAEFSQYKNIMNSKVGSLYQLKDYWLVKDATEIFKMKQDADNKKVTIGNQDASNPSGGLTVAEQPSVISKYLALSLARLMQELVRDTYSDCLNKDMERLKRRREEAERFRQDIMGQEKEGRSEIEKEALTEFQKIQKIFASKTAELQAREAVCRETCEKLEQKATSFERFNLIHLPAPSKCAEKCQGRSGQDEVKCLNLLLKLQGSTIFDSDTSCESEDGRINVQKNYLKYLKEFHSITSAAGDPDIW